MIYSKTLQAETYDDIREVRHVLDTKLALKGVPYRFDHPHRAWEYGLVLAALRANGAKTVLEIGGGGSLFAPAAAMLGREVMQVDRKDCTHWTSKQARRLDISLPYVQWDFPGEYITDRQFDAVVSISVIEHTSADASKTVPTNDGDRRARALFWQKMLDLVKPGGLVAITTDFHPDKVRNIKFNKFEMLGLYATARAAGFDWFGDGYDYTYAGEFVNYYTFASLVLRREDGH